MAARRNDPEVAARLAELPDDDDQMKWTPHPTEWGLVPELLAGVVDRIADLIVATVNSSGPKQPMRSAPRFPRPETEIERARRRAEGKAIGDFEALIEQAKQRWDDEHEDGG